MSAKKIATLLMLSSLSIGGQGLNLLHVMFTVLFRKSLVSCSTVLTFVPVNAEQRTAFNAFPFCAFHCHEVVDSAEFNCLQIFDHTHAIFCPIADVDLPYQFAREFSASKTEIGLGSGQLITVLDIADRAMFHFAMIWTVAARTSVSLALKRRAEKAIHPARSNMLCVVHDQPINPAIVCAPVSPGQLAVVSRSFVFRLLNTTYFVKHGDGLLLKSRSNLPAVPRL
jgi:hypothetical protein